MRRLFQWTVAVSLILAVGGHWTLLQSVAWVNMAVTYSQETSVMDALQRTFDGEHPCKLCKAVDAGKKAESAQSVLKVETKLEFVCARSGLVVYPPDFPDHPSPIHIPPPQRIERPPTPPPRLA